MTIDFLAITKPKVDFEPICVDMNNNESYCVYIVPPKLDNLLVLCRQCCYFAHEGNGALPQRFLVSTWANGKNGCKAHTLQNGNAACVAKWKALNGVYNNNNPYSPENKPPILKKQCVGDGRPFSYYLQYWMVDDPNNKFKVLCAACIRRNLHQELKPVGLSQFSKQHNNCHSAWWNVGFVNPFWNDVRLDKGPIAHYGSQLVPVAATKKPTAEPAKKPAAKKPASNKCATKKSPAKKRAATETSAKKPAPKAVKRSSRSSERLKLIKSEI